MFKKNEIFNRNLKNNLSQYLFKIVQCCNVFNTTNDDLCTRNQVAVKHHLNHKILRRCLTLSKALEKSFLLYIFINNHNHKKILDYLGRWRYSWLVQNSSLHLVSQLLYCVYICRLRRSRFNFKIPAKLNQLLFQCW